MKELDNFMKNIDKKIDNRVKEAEALRQAKETLEKVRTEQNLLVKEIISERNNFFNKKDKEITDTLKSILINKGFQITENASGFSAVYKEFLVIELKKDKE